MTVGGLMSITGTSRSAFYRYFKDLHELIETLLQAVADAIFEAAQSWFSGEGDASVLLKETYSHGNGQHDRYPGSRPGEFESVK
jgi:AcrR family transcriptional regulator